MTVDQLNIKYGLVDRKKDFEIIDFFEKNALTIQNLDEDKDLDTLNAKRCLMSDYGYSLAKNGQIGKSIPILTEAIRLHEKDPEFKENIKSSTGYKKLVFLLGEALYKTKRIEESKKIFEKLIILAPDNESYKSWIIGTLNYRRSEISRVTFIAFIIWMLLFVLFRDSMSGPIRTTSFILGLSIFFTWTTVDIMNWVVKRKYR